jgi:hypothetical protein
METPVIPPPEIPADTLIPKPVEVPPPPPPKRSNWITVIAAIAFIGMLGVIGILSFFVARSISLIDAQETALAHATQTMRAQDEALDKASATMQAQTSTIKARETALAKAQATIQAQEDIIAAIPPGFESTLIKGPISGSLFHAPEDAYIKVECAGVNVKDFIASVQFTNPFAYSAHTFDVGIRFRANFRLIVTNGMFVELYQGPSTFLDTRFTPDMNLGSGETNDLTLMVKDDVVFVTLNDTFSSSMYIKDLSTTPYGDVCIGTGFWQGNEVSGKSTKYDDFSVWALGSD